MSIKQTDFLKFGDDLYALIPPVPSETERGGIIASPKSSTETVEIKLGDNGKLYAPKYPDLTNINKSITDLQTQLNGKSNTSHTHDELTSGLGSFVALYYDDEISKNHFFKPDINYPTTREINLGSNNFRTWDRIYAGLGVYVNGVACSLDGHKHTASDIASGTLSTDRLPTVTIAKGGTGATTAAGALTNLGLTATATELNYCDGVTSNIQTQLNGKSQIVLLWENSSKTSSFSAQTLNLSLGSYDMYVVVARYSSSVGGTTSTICKTGYSSRLQGVGSSSPSSGSTDETISQESVRTVTYSGGSLNIGDALYQGVKKNDSLIPIFIYGIKGVS